jgi:hypothetical protein
MNVNSLINMVIRQITRRAVNAAVDKGIDAAAGAKQRKGSGGPGVDKKRMKQQMRMVRKIGRF